MQQSTLLDYKKCNTIYMNVQLPDKVGDALFGVIFLGTFSHFQFIFIEVFRKIEGC